MSLLGPIVYSTVKVGEIIDAGAQVVDVCDRMDRAPYKIPPTIAEKVNAAFQGFFIVAQVASIGISLTNNINAMIVTEITSGAADITRTITKKLQLDKNVPGMMSPMF